MKKTIAAIIFILAVVWACGGGGGTTVVLPPTVPDKPPPVIDDPEPEPEPRPIIPHTVFVYAPSIPEIGTSDGEFYYPIAQEKSANAGQGFISIGDILHGIDDTGESIITQRLPVAPDKIAISGENIWCFENIFDAMSGKNYTKIWLNNSEYGAWTDNQYTVDKAIVTASGGIATLDITGKHRNVTESTQIVNYAGQGGLLIHSVDITARRATIEDSTGSYRIAFNENYFLSSRPYIEADGIYYSWNGHTWANGVLTERATIMHEFVTLWYSDRPVLAAVGSRTEHGEAVTYWIECNTGWLYRHTPSINSLEMVIRLYQGSGDRGDGINAKAEIKPVLVGDNLYFGWQGTIWKYNFTARMVSSFADGVEIWAM
jgi:hypothetical protein